jgi:hypothetical protein
MKFYVTLFLCLMLGSSIAQIGGNHTFQFLNFTQSARVESLGGFLLTIRDNDATLGQENPALLNRENHGMVNLNYSDYFANSKYGFTSYTKHITNVGTFNAAMLYANYGKFEYANVDGDRDGTTFNASDLALKIGYGRPIDSLWSVGANLKLLGSFYESYTAYGAALDFGANYYKKSSQFGFGFLARNIGMQFKGYTDNNREKLPFEMIAQVSKKLEHAPFRFSLAYHNIQKWNLLYYDEANRFTRDPLTGQTIENKPPWFGKKLASHIILAGEMLLTENFHIRFAYNHGQRQQLKMDIKPGMTGFSLGFGMKIKNFHLSYAINKFHISGTSNQITISKRFGKMPVEDTFYRQY